MKKIVVKFPDGNKREFEAGVTASQVAQTISTSLSKKAISAEVDGSHWDLQWPIVRDSEISINTMKDADRALVDLEEVGLKAEQNVEELLRPSDGTHGRREEAGREEA